MSTCAYWPPEKPEADICLLCGLEVWGCICSPLAPNHKATDAELERARRAHLTRAELASEAGERDV